MRPRAATQCWVDAEVLKGNPLIQGGVTVSRCSRFALGCVPVGVLACIRVRMLGVLVVVAVAIGLAGASTASAYFVPPDTGACASVGPPSGDTGGEYWVNGSGTCTSTWESDSQFQSQVNQEVAAGDDASGTTIPSDIPPADAEAGPTMWNSLVNAASSLKGNALDFLSDLGDWPAFSALGTVGTIGAVGVTAYIGWQIGSALASVLGIDQGSGGTGSGGNTATAAGLIAVSAGTNLATLPGVGCYGAGYNAYTGGCTEYAPIAPSDGWVISWSGWLSGARVQVDESNQSSSCGESVLHTPPTAVEERIGLTSGNEYGCGGYNGQYYSDNISEDVYFVPATITSLPGPGQNPPSSFSTTVQQSPSTQPSEAQQKQNATNMLTSPAFDPFTEALCQVPGSPCSAVSPPYTDKIPSPSAGESWTKYQAQLAKAGITNVSEVVLSAPDADLDEPANTVENISPAPGTSVYPVVQQVTVTVNPDAADMPAPTAREQSLAADLVASNPAITTENKYDVARSCLDLEDAATGNTDTSGDSGDESFVNCSTIPLFITGHDAESAGQHDEIALGVPGVSTDPSLTFSGAYGGVEPAWVLLSRDVPGKKDTWKKSKQPCNSGAPQLGAQCDEYPFLSSQQGGGTAMPQPNLQYISGTQNGRQGTRLSQFYSAAQPSSEGINGCNITYATPFLAIPVPDFMYINTTWACNGRNDS